MRVRRDGYGQRVVGWLETRRSDWTLHLGGGAPVHGAGLLAAPSGARSSLSTETSLTAPRPGWRASTSLDSRQRLLGAALTWRANGISAAGGLARDQEGQQSGYVRAGVARLEEAEIEVDLDVSVVKVGYRSVVIHCAQFRRLRIRLGPRTAVLRSDYRLRPLRRTRRVARAFPLRPLRRSG